MTPTLELRRTEAPAIASDTVLLVSEAFLPLLWWREVPVSREVRQELTQLERFLLEMALALGTFDSDEFEEVVSLPRSVLAGGMSRLVAGGAVSLIGAEFHVITEVAARFLEQEAVTREVESSADFALLPRSGDLLAVSTDKGGSWLRQLELEQLTQSASAPVPRELWSQRRSAYLGGRLREGTVAGPGGDLAAVREGEDDPPLLAPKGRRKTGKQEAEPAGVCPAYRCRAEVRLARTGRYEVHAVVQGRRAAKRSNGDQQDETAEVEVDLTGADGLVESWLDLIRVLDDPSTLRAAWRAIGPPSAYDGEPLAHRTSPAECEFSLSGAAAQAIAEQGRPLTQPVGLAIEGEEAVVELLCRFTPADETARGLFARDTAVAALLGSEAPVERLDAVCQDARAALPPSTPALSPAAVRERIWELGYYRLAYTLREHEDFTHD